MQYILRALELNTFKKKFKIKGDKNMTTNIYRIQAYDSLMCGYLCISIIIILLCYLYYFYFYIIVLHSCFICIISSMFKVKILLNYTILFSLNKYEKKLFQLLKIIKFFSKFCLGQTACSAKSKKTPRSSSL